MSELKEKQWSLKLVPHQKTYSKEEVLVNSRDVDVSPGDILEIFDPQETSCKKEQPHLLLRIPDSRSKEESVQKGNISVEKSIALLFGLQTYQPVLVRKVQHEDVALQLLVLTFRDQYVSRSEMWRFTKELERSVVYKNKVVEFCKQSVRCQVYEMWMQGRRVACGYVSENTKVAYRSCTSRFYLFIQMSSEMWEFDHYGELYYEKAVSGFLTDLFEQWKQKNTNHEVTVVLFSRVFYPEAKKIEQFPSEMRCCIQQDPLGRFFQDFYRVAVQNERHDDWSCVLRTLRQLFYHYPWEVLGRDSIAPVQKIKAPKDSSARPFRNIYESFSCTDIGVSHGMSGDAVADEALRKTRETLQAELSTADQGNFLEVLNMSLNVFDKHYQDRSLERTGQMSVVVTPGTGVFHVDRKLMNITKQRIIDNGVGSDLVCLGEQPLHAVPLLKFYPVHSAHSEDHYSMPGSWINLSYYPSRKRIFNPKLLVPRVKLPRCEEPLHDEKHVVQSGKYPPDVCLSWLTDLMNPLHRVPWLETVEDELVIAHNLLTFKKGFKDSIEAESRVSAGAKISSLTNLKAMRFEDIDAKMEEIDEAAFKIATNKTTSSRPAPTSTRKKTSYSFCEPLNPLGSGGPVRQHSDPELQLIHIMTQRTRESSGPALPGQSCINPFDPRHSTIKLTSYRRRWVHIFPKNPSGALIQQHHREDDSLKTLTTFPLSSSEGDSSDFSQLQFDRADDQAENQLDRHRVFRRTLASYNTDPDTLVWGATGEQRWSAALTTGVDWKSLTLPACLPITTDFFPSDNSIEKDYVVNAHSLLPDAVNFNTWSDSIHGVKKHGPLKTAEVFRELIYHRISQGFQLILPSDLDSEQGLKNKGVAPSDSQATGACTVPSQPNKSDPKPIRENRSHSVLPSAPDSFHEFRLSIGTLFHKLQMHPDHRIEVLTYRPRFSQDELDRTIKKDYSYCFRAPYMTGYDFSNSKFETESLGSYKWNQLDYYISSYSDCHESLFNEKMKFWRVRLVMVSDVQRGVVKSLMERRRLLPDTGIYVPLNTEQQQTVVEGFLKFLENLHRIKRPALAKKNKANGQILQVRERLGSANKAPEKQEISNNLTKSEAPCMEEALGQQKTVEKNSSLSIQSSLEEIVSAMAVPGTGLNFFSPRHPNLPSLSFLSADAVSWIMEHIEGVPGHSQAMALLQQLCDSGYIRHASGNSKMPVYYGFYIYFMPTGNDENDKTADSEAFRQEFHEVEVKPVETKANTTDQIKLNSKSLPGFLLASPPPLQQPFQTSSGRFLNQGPVCIDQNNKSDRSEWGSLLSTTSFSTDTAYFFSLRWLCATGALVTELISSWQRRATSCNLFLFPIPSDPFALPHSLDCNPLRGPLHLPLILSCHPPCREAAESSLLRSLKRFPALCNTHDIFAKFSPESRPRRIRLLQEAILQKFGFVRFLNELSVSGNGAGGSEPNQFVHVTGNVFVMVLTPGIADSYPAQHHQSHQYSFSGLHFGPHQKPTYRTQNRDVMKSALAESFEEGMRCSPHEEYFLRQMTDARCNTVLQTPGFLWSFNYMLTRRWKSAASGEEAFAELLLHDFKHFCANKSDRLTKFCSSFYEQLDASPLPASEEGRPVEVQPSGV